MSELPPSPWGVLAEELEQDLSTPLAESLNHPLVTPLNDTAALRIQGQRWREFLQGQLTCDVREARPDQALAGAFCTPQGRMVANFLLVCAEEDDHAWLQLPRSVAPALQQTLQKYAAFSRVSVEHDPERLGIGILLQPGSPPPPPLASLSPGKALHCHRAEDHLILQRDEAGHRLEWWQSVTAAQESWPPLAAALSPAPPDSWRLLDIRAGLGQVEAETSGSFLPQMLNLDLLGAVSFRKGCYTGQEIIARLHYRGQSRRRMQAVTGPLAADQPPPRPGQRLLDAQGRSQGELVQAVVAAPGRFEGLAVVALPPPTALTLDEAGTEVRLGPLPYAITEE